MRTIHVKQIETQGSCKHVAIHRFNMPDVSDPGFYRTVVAFNAFFNSTKRRNIGEGHLFMVQDGDRIERRTQWERNRDRALPIKLHKDLAAFLEAIGYDRKKKKIIGNA